jgi:protein TonB
MSKDHPKARFHPLSPVQPDRSPAPYFLAAVVAAVVIWTVQQKLIQDSNQATPQGVSRVRPAQAARGDLRSLFSTDDYPASALARSEEGTVQARLDVNTKGLVRRCTIIRSSGHDSLDDATCNILMRRARFAPAHDAHGNAVPDSIVTPPVSWRLEE